MEFGRFTQVIRLFTLVLPLFLALCADIPASASTSSDSISSANTAVTTHDKNGSLLPNALRIQYDVDSDGRVQNIKILESAMIPEFGHKIIEKMMSKWRFEKGKPGMAKRVVAMIQPKSAGGRANKQ